MSITESSEAVTEARPKDAIHQMNQFLESQDAIDLPSGEYWKLVALLDIAISLRDYLPGRVA